MNTPNFLQVDHIDHNGLNNQKNNLRNCTNKENSRNRKPLGFSKYLGVHRSKSKKKFEAEIKLNGHKKRLGIFKLEEDAARAYDNAANFYYGEFANLNFK